MDLVLPATGRMLVAVAMGSNQPPVARTPFDISPPHDPRARALEGALVLLRARGHVVRAASPLYETEPEDVTDPQAHGRFLNACIALEIASSLIALLADCEEVERAAGRLTKGDRGPRPLDLDLLAAWTRGEAESLAPVEAPGAPLELPHPRLAERGFVLAPLAGVLPDAPLPVAGHPGATPWSLLRRLAREGLRGTRPGPASASFPWREAGAGSSDG